MRASCSILLVLVIALSTSARPVGAAPHAARPALPATTDAAWQAADQRWREAEAAPTGPGEVAAWQAAGRAYLSAAKASVGAARAQAALAAVTAWGNAQAAAPAPTAAPAPVDLNSDPPRPRLVPVDDRGLIEAIGLVLAGPTPAGVDPARLWLTRAQAWRRSDHLAEAIVDALRVVDGAPTHPAAEAALAVALDGHAQLRQLDELGALADRLRGTPALLAGRPALAERLRRLQAQVRRRQAEQHERRGQGGDPAALRACGEVYIALGREPDAERADELLYNASVCFERAGELARATEAGEELERRAPRSPLGPRVGARLAMLELRLVHLEAAAARFERLATSAGVADRERRDAASNAIWLWAALGQPTRAARVFDQVRARFDLRDPARVEGQVVIIDSLLRAGAQRAANRRARATLAELAPHRDQPLAVARVLADAACPVPRGSGDAVSLRRCPRPADAVIVARVRRLLALAHADTERAGRPSLELAVFELDVDATPPGPALDRLPEQARDLVAAGADPAIQAAAHASLADLARRRGLQRQAVVHLEDCVAIARRALVAGPQLLRCEQALRRAGEPVDLVRERLPATTGAAPVDVEPAAR